MKQIWADSAMLALVMVSLAAQAATVTGTVTNKTTNKPDAGDAVVLIAFGQGMQEAARTKTDARGHFSIDVPDSAMHLIRVDHQKAAYFEPLPPGTTHVDVTVYDVGAKVEGVSTEADVMRIEAGPQGLHVIQNYFVKNASQPPRTQFSTQAYEIYLPPEAKIEAAAAAGPEGMPVASSPMPQGDKGHFAFVFPVRPGETRFQLSYTLPYSGSYKFTPRLALPAANVAIMLPKSMSFEGGAEFQSADVEASAQTFLAKNVQPSQSLEFTVSGTGVMPRDSEQGGQGQAGSTDGGQGATAANDSRPGGGLGNPIDTPDPLQKYKWWILSGLALLLVIAAAFFLRARPAEAVAPGLGPSPLVPTPMPPESGGDGRGSLLAALKDELFMLETDRLAGKLSEPEYAEHKAALEQVLRRALARQNG
ncbi:MAG TPA: carboxypeptidase regulatory-like domain-containing protein [Silvibacterium sp.]|nr:carboxypeptidase regulatory-like domain-containing protein [Silvibacterium sp.]